MTKANEPAYPQHPPVYNQELQRRRASRSSSSSDLHNDSLGFTHSQQTGLTKHEKLAMEIYVKHLDVNIGTYDDWETTASHSLRAADIFFEQLNK